MTAQTPSPDLEPEKAAYQAACDWYHRIDDFRAMLLGLLPLVSGTGIFFLLDESASKVNKNYLLAVGPFGFAVTLGLLFYELRGVQHCIRISKVAGSLERAMNVVGPFRLRVHSLGGVINEPVAAGIIYPSVLAAWTYVGMRFFESNGASWIVSGLVFIGTLIAILWIFYKCLKEDPYYAEDVIELQNGKR